MKTRSADFISWVGAGLIGMTLAVFVVSGMFIFRDKTNEISPQEISTVVANPVRYSGSQISLKSRVDTVENSRSFTIDNPGIASGQLLVISSKPLEPIGGSGGNEELLVNQEDTVEISGKVQTFSLKQIEAELGIDLVDEDYKEWEGKPVIIASEIIQTE